MLPRGLTGRIVLAFVGLAATMLVAVAATLFFVLHQLHENEIKDSLSRQVELVVVNLAAEKPAQWDSQLTEASTAIAGDGGYILVQNATGAIRVLAGNPSSLDIPSGLIGRTTTSDGKAFIYVEPSENATGGRTIVFAVPDTSVQMALATCASALLIVALVLLIVGMPDRLAALALADRSDAAPRQCGGRAAGRLGRDCAAPGRGTDRGASLRRAERERDGRPNDRLRRPRHVDPGRPSAISSARC